jgi:hypothetical protein
MLTMRPRSVLLALGLLILGTDQSTAQDLDLKLRDDRAAFNCHESLRLSVLGRLKVVGTRRVPFT